MKKTILFVAMMVMMISCATVKNDPCNTKDGRNISKHDRKPFRV
jgi:hypothetical protein